MNIEPLSCFTLEMIERERETQASISPFEAQCLCQNSMSNFCPSRRFSSISPLIHWIQIGTMRHQCPLLHLSFQSLLKIPQKNQSYFCNRFLQLGKDKRESALILFMIIPFYFSRNINFLVSSKPSFPFNFSSHSDIMVIRKQSTWMPVTSWIY